jgi:hypothetical protein
MSSPFSRTSDTGTGITAFSGEKGWNRSQLLEKGLSGREG